MQFYYFQYFARFLSDKAMHYNMHITNLWNEYLQNFKSEKFLSRESHAVAVFFEKLLEMIEPIIQKKLVQTIIENIVRAYIQILGRVFYASFWYSDLCCHIVVQFMWKRWDFQECCCLICQNLRAKEEKNL